MKRWRVIAGLVVLVVVGAAVAYLGRPYPPGPGGRWANLDRVAVGMTQTEAVTAVGIGPQIDCPGNLWDFGPPETQWTMMWSGAECDIWVHLDGGGRVISRQGFGRPPHSWSRRLRDRLGL
jgi:hypothetical protein